MPQSKTTTTLRHEERKRISLLLYTDMSLRAIGDIIGRSKNCITTEVRLNGGRKQYDPDKAQARADKIKADKTWLNKNMGVTLADEAQRNKLVYEMFVEGKSLMEMRKVLNMGSHRVMSIISEHLARLQVTKLIELEKRIALLEGQTKQQVEDGLSEDELYRKYLKK